MNTPSPVHAPANVVAAAAMKMKVSREADKKHNREIGHLVKATSLHRPMITRSMPHVRGR